MNENAHIITDINLTIPLRTKKARCRPNKGPGAPGKEAANTAEGMNMNTKNAIIIKNILLQIDAQEAQLLSIAAARALEYINTDFETAQELGAMADYIEDQKLIERLNTAQGSIAIDAIEAQFLDDALDGIENDIEYDPDFMQYSELLEHAKKSGLIDRIDDNIKDAPHPGFYYDAAAENMQKAEHAAREAETEKVQGAPVYLAMMNTACFSWYAVGDSEEHAREAIAAKWNSNEHGRNRRKMTAAQLDEVYGITILSMPMNTAVYDDDF